MKTSVNSISFVITAIYTGTFASAVYQILAFDEKTISLGLRSGVDVPILLCASICMIMTLRFFFGNNNYVDEIFAKRQSALSRLYHFFVIVVESLILLGSSYLVRNPLEFITWISVLFAVEISWYVGCLSFFRHAISNGVGQLNRPLALNELANVVMASGALVARRTLYQNSDLAIYIVAILFAANTAVDLKVNLKSYMGA
jgi:hypothetical protein